MKREVSPVVVVIIVLVALTAIELIYWRVLVGGPPAALSGPPPGGGASAANQSPPPVGSPDVAVTTLAGTPEPGYRDGAAAEARFDGPAAVAASGDGSVYVADSRNHVIRKIDRTGHVTTFAGVRQTGFGGFADGPAKEARFSAPAGLAVLPDGDLLVSDTGNHRLRRVSQAASVTTFAGADTTHDELGRPTGGYRDGAAAQALFRYPAGLAVDGDGAVYVADAGNHCVRRIAGGTVSTVPVTGGKMDTPTQVALAFGSLWVTDAAKPGAWVGPPAGPLKWQELKTVDEKSLAGPTGVAEGPGGVYVLDAQLHCLFRVASLWYPGNEMVVGERGGAAYADGPGDQARLAQPAGLAAAPGVLYIADFGNDCVRKVTPAPGAGGGG